MILGRCVANENVLQMQMNTVMSLIDFSIVFSLENWVNQIEIPSASNKSYKRCCFREKTMHFPEFIYAGRFRFLGYKFQKND